MNRFSGFVLALNLLFFAEICEAEEKAAEEVFIYQVEKEIKTLPVCNDEKLLTKVREFIADYYEKTPAENVKSRRRRYFVQHNIDKFAEENIANYKTEAARPVSDVIADLKMNKNILEENMLLCKNQSKYKDPGNLYLLVYPENNGYRVYIINLDTFKISEKMSFLYQ